MTGARMAPRFRAMPERRAFLIPPISKRLSEKGTGLLEAP